MMTGSNDILSKTKAKFFKTQKTTTKKYVGIGHHTVDVRMIEKLR